MGDDPRPTGLWLEDLTTPYYAFVDSGAAPVDIASVTGGHIPIDSHSLSTVGKKPPSVERFLKDQGAVAKIEASLPIKSLSSDGYAAVFLPGGHGTMWDLPKSAKLVSLLSSAWANGKVLAAVCHGPAGLVNAKDVQGQPLVAGRYVSAFTNSEEEMAGLTKVVPFLLETRIRELGAHYERGGDFEPFAMRDGLLVTGRNPMSSERVAELTLQAVRDGQ